jgi:hypothetical protein
LRINWQNQLANSNVYEAADFVGRYTRKIAAVRLKGVAETHRAVALFKKGGGLDYYVDGRRAKHNPISRYNPI